MKIAVTGKGGVGKTNIAVNLSVSLARDYAGGDKRVLLIDGDFGLPNADIVLGIKTPLTISDFIEKRVATLAEAVCTGLFQVTTPVLVSVVPIATAGSICTRNRTTATAPVGKSPYQGP